MTKLNHTPLAVFIALLAVVLLACGLAASTWRVFGNTWDEPEHLAAGLELLDQGKYTYDIQHPPIARVLLALGPWLAGARSENTPPPNGEPEGQKILYAEGHYDLYLSLARAGTLPFLALLVVVTFLWARTVTTPWISVGASLLVAVTPAVLGHGALATIDIAAASTTLLALWLARRWLGSGRITDAMALGVGTGVALGTKLSALPFAGIGGPLLLLLAGWARRARRVKPVVSGRRWALGAALVVFLVLVILTLAYGGGFIYLTNAQHKFSQTLWYLFGFNGFWHDLAYQLFSWVKVPEAVKGFLGGVEAVSVHNQNGHLSYLLGDSRAQGWWYFYVVALTVKTPLPFLVLGCLGLARLAWCGIRRNEANLLTLPALWLAILVFVSLFSHINIGVRHVLLLYPLWAIGAAMLLADLWTWCRMVLVGRVRLMVGAGLLLLTLWPLVVVVREWPDYLAYFNVLAPDPEQVLVDSDLDWGQDLQRLSRRLQVLQVPSLSFAYDGSALLDREGLPPFRLLGPDERATGWIAVSALARVHAPDRFAWLNQYPRVEQVGKTIDLYDVPLATPAPTPAP